MLRRTRETGDSALDFLEKNFRRKLCVFNELTRKRKIGFINSLCRREAGVILGSSPESKHH